MTTILPPIPQHHFDQEIQIQQNKNVDAFDKRITKHDKSKTDHVLNLIYSILVGVLSGVLTKKHLKYSKLIGLLIGLCSYLISKQASKIQME